MGKTLAEKILSKKSKKDVKAGDIVLADLDFLMGQDGTSPLAIESFKKFGGVKVFNPKKIALIIDHSAPSPDEEISSLHKLIREFANEQKCFLFDIGEGICHQIMLENFVKPGDLIIGADSHTCTYGALSCLATGVGSSDLAAGLISGKLWFKVPESMKIKLSGKIKKGVFAKDIILYLIGKITAEGANYLSVEFEGELIHHLSIEGRFTICNMVVEMGAKFGIMPYDENTKEWLKKDYPKISADKDAKYLEKKEFNLSSLEPQIAIPHSVDNVCKVKEIEGTAIHQGFLGTCTNGRIEDLKIAAKILQGKKIKSRLIVAPSSKRIYLQALKENIIKTLTESGAVVVNPGCACCVGTHQGIPSDGENVISSANRNFKGRMGNNKANIFLSSPATVAASCLFGKITDPRKLL